MSTRGGYVVSIEKYADTHFIKCFFKKYRSAWDKTFFAIKRMLECIDSLLLTTKAEKIHSANHLHILKCEFSIAGSNISPHASGNRYIAFLDEQAKICTILLLYSKTDIKGSNETQRRESEIRKNYPNIKKHFSGL